AFNDGRDFLMSDRVKEQRARLVLAVPECVGTRAGRAGYQLLRNRHKVIIKQVRYRLRILFYPSVF
ncbi:hypothetical protein J6590_103216, partial [Homalodisca vitripennis]